MKVRPPGVAAIVGLGLATGLMLGFHRWAADPRLLTILAPTVETLAFVLAVWAVSRASRAQRLLLVIVAATTATLIVFGVGEGFYRAVFRRAFVPWTDLSFLPALLNMVFATDRFARIALVATLVAAVVALVAGLVFVVARVLYRCLLRSNRLEIAAALAILLALALPRAIDRISSDDPWDPPPLAALAVRQLAPPKAPLPPAPSLAHTAVAIEPGPDYALPYLRDRDIHLFIVESYGHTVLSNGDHRDLMEPVYERLGLRLRRAGYRTRTGFLVSPAFGGRSWLADATMLTGRFIETQHEYDSIVESGAENLTHMLGDAGYHRVLAAPGTYEAGESWRAFYEFDQYLFRYDFGYRGPFVSFGAMPDQFLIKRANELAGSGEKPLFMNYVLVSSHVPFDRLPAYVEDWSRLGDGSIFNELPIRTFDNNWLTGGEYPQGYVASIEYTLTSIVEFLARRDDESLVIIVGDHQPRIPISDPDASFSVPVHIVSRDDSLVDPFRHYGFGRGFAPQSSLARDVDSHPSMDRLLEMIMDVSTGITKMYDYLEP